jgi:outer membrane scaffolding protein for murein synthesis (MipA/OmpV family)
MSAAVYRRTRRRARIVLPALAAAGLAASPAAAGALPPDWTVEAGAAARVRPAHIGSSQYLIDSAPILEAQLGDDISISLDDGAKWRALKLGPVRLGPIVEYRQSFNDKLPKGAFRMSDAIELGGFGEARTPVGIAEARLRRALNGYDGWSGDLSFSSGGAVTPKLSLGGQLRVSWADNNFTQEYFGLQHHAARRFRLPRILASDFITAGAEFDAARQLTPRARLVVEIAEDRIVGELRPSPLFASRNIFTTTLGLTYRWSAGSKGRSS